MGRERAMRLVPILEGVEDGEQSSKIDDLWDGGIEDYSERESAEPGVHGNCSILQR